MTIIHIAHRFTDFLVYEVDLDHNVVHVKSLDMPESSHKKEKYTTVATDGMELDSKMDVEPVAQDTTVEVTQEDDGVSSKTVYGNFEATSSATVGARHDKGKAKEIAEPWPGRFSVALAPFLSEDKITKVKTMLLEGPEPPRVSDSGWGGRTATPSETRSAIAPGPMQEESEQDKRRRKNDRGGRGARGGRDVGRREDNRKVVSDVRISWLVYFPMVFS
jgi:tRNA pseudouridine13 synthase